MSDEDLQTFEHLCREKYVKGILAYRGGDASLPFNGDLKSEYSEEQIDSVNYLRDMLFEGEITEEVFKYLYKLHFEAWWAMRVLMK